MFYAEIKKFWTMSLENIRKINLLLMMSLGAGTLKVSVGPKASSREEVYMATLEVGTIPQAAH